MRISEREWLIINKLILMMNSIEDCDQMREYVMHSFKRLIDYDAASFYLSTPHQEGPLLRQPIGVGFSLEDLEYYAREHSGDAPLAWTNEYPINLVILDSSMMEDDEKSSTWYYTTIREKFGLEHSLTISMAWKGCNVGLLTFLRKRGGGDFSERDVYIAQQLIDHIAFALFRFCDKGHDFSSEPLRHRLRDIARSYCLSSREEEIFRLLCASHSPEAICRALCISPATFKKHAGAIYRKMNIGSRYEIMGILFPELAEVVS